MNTFIKQFNLSLISGYYYRFIKIYVHCKCCMFLHVILNNRYHVPLTVMRFFSCKRRSRYFVTNRKIWRFQRSWMTMLYGSLVNFVRWGLAARRRPTEFIRVFYYLRHGYKAVSFIACVIVGETFKRLIRMNDRLDVAVSWEGPNTRPGDCRLMFPRLLALRLVLSPRLFSRCFSHSLASLRSSFLPTLSIPLLPVSSCLRYASPTRTSRLSFHWFATQEIAFHGGVSEDL